MPRWLGFGRTPSSPAGASPRSPTRSSIVAFGSARPDTTTRFEGSASASRRTLARCRSRSGRRRWEPGMSRQSLVVQTMVELADTLVDDFDVVDLLTTLAERCVDIFDATAVGIMLATPDGELR